MNTPGLDLVDKLDRFRKKALALGTGPADVERWLTLARRCAVLSPHGHGPVVGRLGGPVMLPPGVPVPSTGWKEPEPYHLIASLDLAALPGDATSLPLPADGHLLLFALPDLDAVEGQGAAVYIPAGTIVEERHLDYRDPAYSSQTAPGPASELRDLGDLRLSYDVSLPAYEIFNDDAVIDLAAHPRARELCQAWMEVLADDLGPSGPRPLQIDGYAWDHEGWGDPVQSSPYLIAATGRAPGWWSRPGDWVLLAQWEGLATASVYWTMTWQDIAARRFDRALVTMYAGTE